MWLGLVHVAVRIALRQWCLQYRTCVQLFAEPSGRPVPYDGRCMASRASQRVSSEMLTGRRTLRTPNAETLKQSLSLLMFGQLGMALCVGVCVSVLDAVGSVCMHHVQL